MLFNNSLWELIEGYAAFDGAGSLSHRWATTPADYLLSEILGIKILKCRELIRSYQVPIVALNGPTPNFPALRHVPPNHVAMVRTAYSIPP
jgi:hypothetical protein